MLNGILSLRLVPLTHVAQLGSGQRNFDKQTFHQWTVQLKQFFVLFVIVCYFLFGDLSVIGNIALRLIEQQNIFYPATDVVLGEKKTVIF